MSLIDAASASAAISALKGAMDILKSLKDLSGSSATKTQIAELYEKIISAREASLSVQEERAALLERISELEKELVCLKTWGRKKEQYELKNVAPGALAYVPKPGTDASKEPHWLCAQCAEEGQPGYLQAKKGDMRQIH